MMINPTKALVIRCLPASAALGLVAAVSIVKPPEMSMPKRIRPDRARR